MNKFAYLSIFALCISCIAQVNGVSYLVRLEHQTRQEDVCMLLQKDGHYHLERVSEGTAHVFEGTLEPSVVSELESHLNTPQIVALRQGQIDSSPTNDVDQLMITIPRPAGWQKLVFSSAQSRKPYKTDVDPIIKWLDYNQQPANAIGGAPSTRCIPTQPNQTATATVNPAANPYMMRLVVDRYELKGGGTAIASVSAAKGTTGNNIGGLTNSDAMDINSFKITHTCAVVYNSGRYRLEKNMRESGKVVKSETYRDTLDKAQIAGLRELLDSPKLATLPSNAAPAFFGRDSEFTSLTVPRDKAVQSVNVATSAPHNASSDLREAALQALAANVGLTNPIWKWVKQNIEERKTEPLKDAPQDGCVPSPQPE